MAWPDGRRSVGAQSVPRVRLSCILVVSRQLAGLTTCPLACPGELAVMIPTDPGAVARLPLSRERVLRAAIALADEAGLGSLTMRKLGQRLGVEAMSLYKHVANKEDILDGIIDLVVSEIDLPPYMADWKAAMRLRAISARAVFVRHPWALGVLESRTNPGPAALGYTDRVIGILRHAGFSVVLAAHAFAMLDSYIYGFAVQELSLPFHTTEELNDMVGMILDQLPADRFPHLAEMANEHILRPGYAFANEFEFGLEVILDGLERLKEGVGA